MNPPDIVPPSTPPPPPPSDGAAGADPAVYYLNRDGQQQGPFSVSTLRSMIAAGSLAANVPTWKEGWSGWQPVSTVTGTAPPAAGGGAGFPKMTMPAVKMPPLGPLAERFLGLIHRFGRTVAVVLAALFTLGVLWGILFFVWHAFSGLHTPTYDEVANGEKATVEKQYGDKLKKIVIDGGLPADGYNSLLNRTVRVDEDDRSVYVSGLESFFKDYKAAKDKDASKVADYSSAAENYTDAFEREVIKAKVKKEVQATKRWTGVVMAFFSLMAVVFLLLVPVWLRTEENTAKP